MRSSWDDIPLLLACLRTGSLTAAARELGLDTSTASRRLVVLERQLGLHLFERTRTGLVPTAAGRGLRGPAEEAERGVLHLLSMAGAAHAAAEGTVRISAVPGLAEALLTPLLAELMRAHPLLRFELDTSPRVVDLERREADIAIRNNRPDSGELVSRRLGAVRWVAGAAPALVRRLGVVDDWAALPWIGWTSDVPHKHVSRWLERHGSPPVLRTSDFAAQLHFATLGTAAVIAPFPFLEPYGLVPLEWSEAAAPAAEAWPTDTLNLVTHASLRNEPRVAVVWDAIVARLGAPG